MIHSRKIRPVGQAQKTAASIGQPFIPPPALQNQYRVIFRGDEWNGTAHVVKEFPQISMQVVTVQVDMILHTLTLEIEQAQTPSFFPELLVFFDRPTEIEIHFLDTNGNVTVSQIFSMEHRPACRSHTYGLDYASQSAIVHKMVMGFR